MALKKKINKCGFDFEYIMISITSFVKESNKTYITVNLYKDKTTRDEDITNFVESIDFYTEGNKNLSECYNYLKTTDTFKDAEDC